MAQPLDQLITVLNGSIKGGNLTRALRLLVTNLPRTRGNYGLRRFVAEVLVELGKEREAAEIFEVLVRHFTNSGDPLEAIAIAKKLEDVEPNIGGHLDHIASVYARTSPFLDPDLSLGQPPADGDLPPLDLSGTEPDLPLEALAGVAHEIALRKEDFASSPDSVPPIPLLSHLESPALRTLLDAMVLRRITDGHALLEAGEKPTTTAWIVSGELRAKTGDGRVGRVGRGAIVGHRAIMPIPRTARISLAAVGDVELLSLDRAALAELSENPDVVRTVAQFDLGCRVEIAIASCDLFGEITGNDRKRLVSYFDARAVPDGSILIAQGQPVHGFYLVVEGKVDINKHEGEWEMTVSTLQPGETVGERTLAGGRKAMTSAVTDGPSRVMYMSRANFHKMCERYPSVVERLRQADAR